VFVKAKNKLPVNEDKRLYYQYVGFVDTLCLFENKYETLKPFPFISHTISPEEFQNFSLPLGHMTLGVRVEKFFKFYINYLGEYVVLKQNIQILDDKITIGELDFILRHKQSQKIIHLELAYKFYIFKKDYAEEIKNFIGPNAHDTLNDRIIKLQAKQMPLLYKEVTKKYLEDIDIKSIEQNLLILGNLFLSYDDNTLELEFINKNCQSGSYTKYENFLLHEKFRNLEYFIPEKQDWLIPQKYCEVWYSYEEVKEEIHYCINQNISPLVWIKSEDTYTRMFILV
jgi:hypothetical protein